MPKTNRCQLVSAAAMRDKCSLLLAALLLLTLALPVWATSHTFDTASTADNALCESATSASYPPAFSSCFDNTAMLVHKDKLPQYQLSNGFMRWTDSGALLVGQVISSASLELCIQPTSLNDTNARSLSCEWYANWTTLSVSDFTNGDGSGTALTVTLASLDDSTSPCTPNVLALTNPDANIVHGGTTALRCVITGTAPTGANDFLAVGSQGDFANAPKLNVVFSAATPTATPTGTLVATETPTVTVTATATPTPTGTVTPTATPWCNQLPLPACNVGVGTPAASDTPIANAVCNGGTGQCATVTVLTTPTRTPTRGLVLSFVAPSATAGSPGPTGTETPTSTFTPTGTIATGTPTQTRTVTPTSATLTPTPTKGQVIAYIAPTRTPRHCKTITPTGTRPTATATPTPIRCCGDCGHTGTVTANDLQTCIEIFNGLTPLSTCPMCDCTHNGSVTIDDLVTITNNHIDGCGVIPPTETPTVTPTPHGCECGVGNRIAGVVFRPDGTPDANDTVTIFSLITSPTVLGGCTVNPQPPVSTPTDVNGNLAPIILPCGMPVSVTLAHGGGSPVQTYVPYEATTDFADFLAQSLLGRSIP